MADHIEHMEQGELNTEDAPVRPCTPLGFSLVDEHQRSGISHSITSPDDAQTARSLTDQDAVMAASISRSSTEATDHVLGICTASLLSISTNNPESVDTISGPTHSRLNLVDSHETCGGTLSSSDDEELDSEEFESDCSSCDSSDEEFCTNIPPPSPPMTPPPSPHRSVSRLSFPFSKPKLRPRVSIPPAPRRSPSPPPPPVKKFCCLPSPLSPSRTLSRPDCPPTAPTRHNYEEHGYSRHALLNLKWFWSTREDEWDVKASTTGDISSLSGGTSGVSRSNKLGPSIRMSKKARLRMDVEDLLPPPTIHPRRGDISALRDPWCANIDRCFVTLPVWTISKTLWMYDMHVESDRREKAEEVGAEDDTESEADTSMSTGCSDDSDATLVESESESDLKLLSSRIPSMESISGSAFDGEKESSAYSSCGESSSSSPFPSTYSLTRDYLLSKVNSESDMSSLSSLASFDMSNSPPSSDPRWITDWYGRWELIVKLTRRDQERKRAEYMALQVQTSSTTSKGFRFFIAGGEGNSESNFWDDEDNATGLKRTSA